MKHLSYLLLVFSLLACDSDNEYFEVIDEGEYYANENNVETLMRRIKAEPIRFEYNNQSFRSIKYPLEIGNNEEHIAFDLTQLSFSDSSGQVYRGAVDVSYEYIYQDKGLIRRGMTSLSDNMDVLNLNIAFRLIFTDTDGERLLLNNNGLPLSIRRKSNRPAKELFSVSTTTHGYPIKWIPHSESDKMDLQVTEIMESGEKLFEYNLQLQDDQWVALGRKSDPFIEASICITLDKSELNTSENTILYAILDSDESTILPLEYNGTQFCSTKYPENSQIRIIACSLSDYVEYFYSEIYYHHEMGEDVSMMTESISLEDLISTLEDIQ